MLFSPETAKCGPISDEDPVGVAVWNEGEEGASGK